MRLKNPTVSSLPWSTAYVRNPGKIKGKIRGIYVQENPRSRYSGQIVTPAVSLVETPATTLPLKRRETQKTKTVLPILNAQKISSDYGQRVVNGKRLT